MSYELKINRKDRIAGRFIGKVRKALVAAALEEREKSGITQQEVARRLGVNRSVINRLLRGETNLTLRSVAELAWALGWEPDFSMRRREGRSRANHQFPPTTEQIDRVKVEARSTNANTYVTAHSGNYVHVQHPVTRPAVVENAE